MVPDVLVEERDRVTTPATGHRAHRPSGNRGPAPAGPRRGHADEQLPARSIRMGEVRTPIAERGDNPNGGRREEGVLRAHP